jgi:hypothetical protein
MSAPAAPPPSGPSMSYPPSPMYQPAPAAASTMVRIPAWLDFGVIIGFLGGILVLVGFSYGNGYASDLTNGTSASTLQSMLEGFFVWCGVGFFLVVLGWALHIMLPLFMNRPKKAPAPYAAPMAPMAAPAQPTPDAMPATMPMAAAPAAAAAAAPTLGPAVTPGAPNCANCGKPTTYIAQYGRYYCYSCARYV